MSKGSSRSLTLSLAAAWALGALVAATPAPAAQPLVFQVRQGRFLNVFLREGPVAAHLVLRSGTDPRLLIAFPAGDSGVGLWFEHGPEVRWRAGRPQPAQAHDSQGRALHGMSVDVWAVGRELTIREAVLSSVRVLRDERTRQPLPPGIAATPVVRGNTLTWSRNRLDGAPGYRLAVEVRHGELRGARILSGHDGRIGLRIIGLTGERPLTPLTGRQLLREPVTNTGARETLEFLAYRQKLLAGSWRFDTYFGRDTLMSVHLLMPVLAAPAIDDALSSVLARLSPRGEVAHEEDIGEQAVLDHLQSGVHSAAPVYHYQMIDEDYMLAPDAAAWLLSSRGRAGAGAYLAAPVGGPLQRRMTRGAALVENLRFVLQSAEPFARAPSVAHLIGLKPGMSAGDWRDSGTGLGGGHYPYDVNAALVPAALRAAARLQASGLLAPYLSGADHELFARAGRMAAVWRKKAPPLFDVSVPHAQAARDIQRYAAARQIDPRPALAALEPGAVHFHALALSVSGRPIAVMQSDEGYRLLFGHPDARSLDRIAALLRPFPAGLLTGAGMVVADPVYCPRTVRKLFTRNAYHGTVVWSWQQALFAAGLARQLKRRDLPPAVRVNLRRAQRRLWAVIRASRSMENAELWSWRYAAGRYEMRPFGSSSADATESDAAQLWSTVYLAVRPPKY